MGGSGGGPISGGSGAGVDPVSITPVGRGDGSSGTFQDALAFWLPGDGNITVSMLLGGEPAVNPPPYFREAHPHDRVNYVDVPWGASIPANGCILLHSEQLARLEQQLNDPVSLELEFRAVKTDTAGNITQTLSQKLRYFGLDRAFPLAGAHEGPYQSDQFYGDEFAEGPTSFTGLWMVYFKDRRAARMLFNLEESFNLTDPSGRRYITATIDPDTGEKYTYLKLIQVLFDQSQLEDEPGRVVPDTVNNTDLTPRNLSFRNIPGPIALDIVLHQIGFCYYEDLAVPDTRPEERYRFDKMFDRDGYTNTHNAIKAFKQLRLHCGTVRRYPALNVPEKFTVVFPKVSKYGNLVGIPEAESYEWTELAQRDAVYPAVGNATPIAGTAVPIHTQMFSDEATTQTMRDAYAQKVVDIHNARHFMAPGVMSFSGWLVAFTKLSHLSMISFQYNNGRAITSIEVMGANPMGLLAKRRMDHAAKGEPVPVGVNTNNTVVWEQNEEGIATVRQVPQFFFGKIISRSVNADGTGRDQIAVIAPFKTDSQLWYTSASIFATPVDEDRAVTAFIFYESILDVNDAVLCFYVGMADPKWVAIGLDPVRMAGRFRIPDASCQCDDTYDCDDTTEDPVDVDAGDPLAE